MLIDEDYLKTKGVSNFDKYRCVKDYEPIKLDYLWDNPSLLVNHST